MNVTMEELYSYTFIIPHKNRPELLRKAIAAIPRREDVQIIIVDDDSDPAIVDFNTFPGLNEENIEVVLTKEAKGAGYARNVGLSKAKGKWVVFADSDDYYLDNLVSVMDTYVDSTADLILFKQIRVDADGNNLECGYDPIFDNAIQTGNYDELKYEYYCPIARFVRRSFIEKNNIRFQEVRFSNDVLFSIKTGVLAKKIEVIDKAIYCVCETPNSLIRNKNWRNPYIRTNVSIDAYNFLKEKKLKGGMKRLAMRCFTWWQNTFYAKKTAALKLIPRLVTSMGLKTFYYFPIWLSSKI